MFFAVFALHTLTLHSPPPAQLANTETERVVVGAQKQDAQVAAATSAFTF